MSLSSSSADNRVVLRTEENDFDIAIGRLDAGGGNVLIDSSDDIFDTDVLDDLFIEAGILTATSRNGRIDVFDGIVPSGMVLVTSLKGTSRWYAYVAGSSGAGCLGSVDVTWDEEDCDS